MTYELVLRSISSLVNDFLLRYETGTKIEAVPDIPASVWSLVYAEVIRPLLLSEQIPLPFSQKGIIFFSILRTASA